MAYSFNNRKSSGIFIPNGNGFSEYKEINSEGSINQITNAFGYHTDQIHCPSYGNPKDKIHYIGMEIFTRNIVYILANTNTTFITQKDVNKFLDGFSVTKEFDGKRVDEILNDGIDNQSLSVDFTAKVLKLEDVSDNGMFYSERIQTYLYFTDGYLSNFHFDDGLFPWARHLQKVNPTIYNWLESLAKKYRPGNDFQEKKEINIQCEAWSKIPEAFGNEFISLHRTENGGANLHMLLVCHYGYPISLNEFRELNHGRYNFITSNENQEVYSQGRFNYTFDKETDMLIQTELMQL